MKKTLLCAMVMLPIVLAIISANASGAITHLPGVTVGSHATYHCSTSSTPNFFFVNKVSSISGTNVTYSKATYNSTGTLTSNHTFVHDITTFPTTMAFYFIAKNLNATNRVVPSSAIYVIAGEKNVTFAGKSWNANYMNASASGIIIDAAWDKATGLLLYQWRNDSFNVWTRITIVTDSSIPGSTVGIPDVFGVICAAMGFAVIVIVVKRKITPSSVA